MWIFLNDAFLSIVKDRNDDSKLLVRSRFPSDIKRVFPKARVTTTADADYLYRASIDRERVATMLANELQNIDYPNFKDSVKDDVRHDVYMNVWRLMSRAQQELNVFGPKRFKHKR